MFFTKIKVQSRNIRAVEYFCIIIHIILFLKEIPNPMEHVAILENHSG